MIQHDTTLIPVHLEAHASPTWPVVLWGMASQTRCSVVSDARLSELARSLMADELAAVRKGMTRQWFRNLRDRHLRYVVHGLRFSLENAQSAQNPSSLVFLGSGLFTSHSQHDPVAVRGRPDVNMGKLGQHANISLVSKEV